MNSEPQFSRRRLLAMGGGLALATALSACGDSDKEPSSESSSANDTTATTAAMNESATTASGSDDSEGGDAALSQWYHGYGEEGVEEAVNRYASKYPAATIEVVWKPGDYDQPTVAALLTDDGPDVFEYGNGPTLDMILGGQVVDMTDLFGDALTDFNPTLIQRVTWDDKIWAIPQILDMQCFVYRKSWLEKAGVTPPETVDELIAAAKALTTDDHKGLYLGEAGGADLLGGSLLWASGQDYINDSNEVGFTAVDGGAAVAKLREIWESDTLLLGTPEDWYSATPFFTDQVAFQWTGLWTFPEIIDAIGDDFGAIAFPMLPGGAPSVPIGAYGSCVSAKASDVTAAKAFAKWLWIDQTDLQLDFATAYGFHVPARKSLVPQATTLKDGAAAEAAALAAKVGHAQDHILWTETSRVAFTDAMSRIVKDGADPVAELQAVIDIVNEELARVLS